MMLRSDRVGAVLECLGSGGTKVPIPVELAQQCDFIQTFLPEPDEDEEGYEDAEDAEDAEDDEDKEDKEGKDNRLITEEKLYEERITLPVPFSERQVRDAIRGRPTFDAMEVCDFLGYDAGLRKTVAPMWSVLEKEWFPPEVGEPRPDRLHWSRVKVLTQSHNLKTSLPIHLLETQSRAQGLSQWRLLFHIVKKTYFGFSEVCPMTWNLQTGRVQRILEEEENSKEGARAFQNVVPLGQRGDGNMFYAVMEGTCVTVRREKDWELMHRMTTNGDVGHILPLRSKGRFCILCYDWTSGCQSLHLCHQDADLPLSSLSFPCGTDDDDGEEAVTVIDVRERTLLILTSKGQLRAWHTTTGKVTDLLCSHMVNAIQYREDHGDVLFLTSNTLGCLDVGAEEGGTCASVKWSESWEAALGGVAYGVCRMYLQATGLLVWVPGALVRFDLPQDGSGPTRSRQLKLPDFVRAVVSGFAKDMVLVLLQNGKVEVLNVHTMTFPQTLCCRSGLPYRLFYLGPACVGVLTSGGTMELWEFDTRGCMLESMLRRMRAAALKTDMSRRSVCSEISRGEAKEEQETASMASVMGREQEVKQKEEGSKAGEGGDFLDDLDEFTTHLAHLPDYQWELFMSSRYDRMPSIISGMQREKRNRKERLAQSP